MKASNEKEKPALTVRREAMNMLSRREHSLHELLEKLAAKYPDFNPREDISPALEKLRDEALQSDARFAENYVRYRSNRGMGPLKIAAELYPRKLDAALVAELLSDQHNDWNRLCEQVLFRKFPRQKTPTMAERQRWMLFLQQRGFTHAQIAAVIRGLPDAALPDESWP